MHTYSTMLTEKSLSIKWRITCTGTIYAVKLHNNPNPVPPKHQHSFRFYPAWCGLCEPISICTILATTITEKIKHLDSFTEPLKTGCTQLRILSWWMRWYAEQDVRWYGSFRQYMCLNINRTKKKWQTSMNLTDTLGKKINKRMRKKC